MKLCLILHSYLRSYDTVEVELSVSSKTENPYLNKLTANPIHVFNCMKRLTTLNSNFEILPERFQQVFINFKSKVNFPTQMDFYDGANLLQRIQYFYSLDPYNIAHGKLRNRNTHARLTPEDVFELGLLRFEGHSRLNGYIDLEYALAIEWAEAALKFVSKLIIFMDKIN